MRAETLSRPAPGAPSISELLVLFVILLAALAVRLWFYVGPIGNDDLKHAYHAYFLFQPDSAKHAVIDFPDEVIFRRLGVNLPLWLSMKMFGVEDWSLALVPTLASLGGLVCMYAAMRMLGGPAAGLIAAGIWAFLPMDVYVATVWLQDSIFVGCFAVALLLLVSAERQTGWRARSLALLAGLTVGYMQYVKETSFLLLGVVVLYGLALAVRERRWNVWLLWPAIGYGVMQIVMAIVFWKLVGSATYYWRETIALFMDPGLTPHGGREVLERLQERLFEPSWLLGYAAPLAPVCALLLLAGRGMALRGLLVLLLALQAYVTFMATKMTSGQDRYVLQLSVPLIAILSLGTVAALGRMKWKWRGWLIAVAGAGLVAATGIALRGERQQFGGDRTTSLRQAYAYVSAMASEKDRIYTQNPSPARNYTRRALYQFNQFRKLKAGFADVADAKLARHGFVVLSHLEKQDDVKVPDNWVLVLDAPPRRRGARVYKILDPKSQSAGLQKRNIFSYPRDAARIEPVLVGEGGKDPGELISAEGAIRVHARGATPPNWLFLRDSQTPLRAAPGPRVPAGASVVTFRMTVVADRPAEIRLGFQIMRMQTEKKIAQRVKQYSQTFQIGKKPQTLEWRFRDTDGAGGYFVPMVRLFPPDEYQLEISQFDVLVEF